MDRCEFLEVLGQAAALVCKIPSGRWLLCCDPSLIVGHHEMGRANGPQAYELQSKLLKGR